MGTSPTFFFHYKDQRANGLIKAVLVSFSNVSWGSVNMQSRGQCPRHAGEDPAH